MSGETRVMREIPLEWERLMLIAAKLEFGEAKVVFQNSKPVRIDFAVKQIKLENGDFEEGLKTIPIL